VILRKPLLGDRVNITFPAVCLSENASRQFSYGGKEMRSFSGPVYAL
jgi:hypothetical protein